MRLTFSDAQRNVTEIANRESYSLDVLYELLAAYGRSASAITKLRSGTLNLAEDKENEVLQRGVVYFKHVPDGNLLSVVDSLDQDPLVVRYNPRYLIATDYNQLVAKDTKKDTTLDIKLRDIDRNVDFFYGWTGDEVTSEKTEAIADRRAADKMKDLYGEIEKVNHQRLADPKGNFRHDLNVFFSRLLFCFFAEDTRIFSKDAKTIFTSSIKDFTLTDGSDLDEFLDTLFNALDTEDKSGFTSPYSKFPYVNGTIFDTKKHNIAIPKFNAQARKLMLDCGNLDWSSINPDIFGSMFQSIVDEDHRSNNGMHYTSVPNILKTIEPLFLDELREDFDTNYDNQKKLEKLWNRISKIKIFDPACGSGNFLIIAYKKLREIEHGIIDRLYSDDYRKAQLAGRLESRIKLDNFYGIEIDDFAHEIAILSLYLAKHQMNIEFEEHFGKEISLIPLEDNAKIVHGNAARVDWNEVCPNIEHDIGNPQPDQQYLLEIEAKNEQKSLISDEDLKQKSWDEIYLIGNPPYAGSRKQDVEQKSDMDNVFAKVVDRYRSMDYVAIWFYKATKWLSENDRSAFSFVSVNSISQGIQVELIWPLILRDRLKIDYAYTSFKWENSATNNAGVTCVIIAMSNRKVKEKFIYTDFVRKVVDDITPYLSESTGGITVSSRQKPLSGFPEMNFGNMPADGGNLILSEEEKNMLVSRYPHASQYIYELVGARELIQSHQRRYCLWLSGVSKDDIDSIPEIRDRVAAVRDIRKDSSRPKLADIPHLFAQITADPTKYDSALVFPRVSSQRRTYMPLRFADKTEIVADSCLVVPDAKLYQFAVVTSRMHMTWLRAVGGKMKTDYRYSKDIVYNTFPIRTLTQDEQNIISKLARSVLFARENHSEKTLAEMYDPNKMPEDLQQAHHELDLTVDRLYRAKPYNNDEERLADLFTLYEQMIANEKEKTK